MRIKKLLYLQALCTFSFLYVVLFCGCKSGNSLTNVILIGVDTLRADYLSCYNGKAKTPNIDFLSQNGTLFETAYSNIPITGPSFASIFTGLYPYDHGVHGNAQYLQKDFLTLAEIMKSKNYNTAAFVSLTVLKGGFGFEQGFNEYISCQGKSNFNTAEEVNSIVLPWLDNNYKQPFFMFIHYSDPHEPYSPPGIEYSRFNMEYGNENKVIDINGCFYDLPLEIPIGGLMIHLNRIGNSNRKIFFRWMGVNNYFIKIKLMDGWKNKWDLSSNSTKFPATIRLINRSREAQKVIFKFNCKEDLSIRESEIRYSKEVEYLDKEIGKLIKKLEKLRILDNTLVIFTSDHGEGLGEHDECCHIEQLYDSMLHVPLILMLNDQIIANNRIREAVSLVDLFPTIMDLCNINCINQIRGKSLMTLINGKSMNESNRCIMFETYRPNAKLNLRGLRLGDLKYIVNTDYISEEELYQLSKDPEEKVNIAKNHPDWVSSMKEELNKLVSENLGENVLPVTIPLNDEDKDKFRSLGYIQ